MSARRGEQELWNWTSPDQTSEAARSTLSEEAASFLSSPAQLLIDTGHSNQLQRQLSGQNQSGLDLVAGELTGLALSYLSTNSGPLAKLALYTPRVAGFTPADIGSKLSNPLINLWTSTSPTNETALSQSISSLFRRTL